MDDFHVIDIYQWDNSRDNSRLMSSCTNVNFFNAKCAAFYTSALFSSALMVFAFVKLYHIDPTEDRSVYIGMLTSIIGTWLPSPAFPTKDDTAKKESLPV